MHTVTNDISVLWFSSCVDSASVYVATEPEEAISDTEKLMAELQRRNTALERRVTDMQRVISEHEPKAQQRHLQADRMSETNGLQEVSVELRKQSVFLVLTASWK